MDKAVHIAFFLVVVAIWLGCENSFTQEPNPEVTDIPASILVEYPDAKIIEGGYIQLFDSTWTDQEGRLHGKRRWMTPSGFKPDPSVEPPHVTYWREWRSSAGLDPNIPYPYEEKAWRKKFARTIGDLNWGPARIEVEGDSLIAVTETGEKRLKLADLGLEPFPGKEKLSMIVGTGSRYYR